MVDQVGLADAVLDNQINRPSASRPSGYKPYTTTKNSMLSFTYNLPFVSFTCHAVWVWSEIGILLVDAVVGQMHELIGQTLHRRGISEKKKIIAREKHNNHRKKLFLIITWKSEFQGTIQLWRQTKSTMDSKIYQKPIRVVFQKC